MSRKVTLSGRPLNCQARLVIYNVYQYLKEQKLRFKLRYNVCYATSEATGVSTFLVKAIANEGKKSLETGTLTFTTPIKTGRKGPRAKRKNTDEEGSSKKRRRSKVCSTSRDQTTATITDNGKSPPKKKKLSDGSQKKAETTDGLELQFELTIEEANHIKKEVVNGDEEGVRVKEEPQPEMFETILCGPTIEGIKEEPSVEEYFNALDVDER